MKKYAKLISQKQLTIKDVDLSFNSAKISSIRNSYEYCKQFYHEDIEIYESLFCIFLNSQNNTIAFAKISQGGLLGTMVDQIIIAKYAVDTLARSVILVHNHPSGALKPSDSDVRITKIVRDALELLNVKTLDHLIISKDGYYSFSDEGLM